jgi:Tol biopolymer transport system component
MPASGGKAQRLTQDHARILGLTWMPDSGGIVFSSHRAPGRTAIYLLPQQGGDTLTVVAGEANAQYPSIAPLQDKAGVRLVYQERRRNHRLQWSDNLLLLTNCN